LFARNTPRCFGWIRIPPVSSSSWNSSRLRRWGSGSPPRRSKHGSGRQDFSLQEAVGSTDCTDSTDWKPVERGCGFTRRVKWKRRSVEAPGSSPSVKSVKSVDNPTAAFRLISPPWKPRVYPQRTVEDAASQGPDPGSPCTRRPLHLRHLRHLRIKELPLSESLSGSPTRPQCGKNLHMMTRPRTLHHCSAILLLLLTLFSGSTQAQQPRS